MADASAPLVTVDNVALKLERALYQLYQAVTSKDFQDIRSKLPEIIKSTILGTLGQILKQLSDVVSDLVKGNLLTQVRSLLDAGLNVVDAGMDLLPQAAQQLAQQSKRLLKVVVDLATAGTEHIQAIIDLLGRIGDGLAGAANTALQAGTISLLGPAPAR